MSMDLEHLQDSLPLVDAHQASLSSNVGEEHILFTGRDGYSHKIECCM